MRASAWCGLRRLSAWLLLGMQPVGDNDAAVARIGASAQEKTISGMKTWLEWRLPSARGILRPAGREKKGGRVACGARRTPSFHLGTFHLVWALSFAHALHATHLMKAAPITKEPFSHLPCQSTDLTDRRPNVPDAAQAGPAHR